MSFNVLAYIPVSEKGAGAKAPEQLFMSQRKGFELRLHCVML
jgi:hypothetical protein